MLLDLTQETRCCCPSASVWAWKTVCRASVVWKVFRKSFSVKNTHKKNNNWTETHEKEQWSLKREISAAVYCHVIPYITGHAKCAAISSLHSQLAGSDLFWPPSRWNWLVIRWAWMVERTRTARPWTEGKVNRCSLFPERPGCFYLILKRQVLAWPVLKSQRWPRDPVL